MKLHASVDKQDVVPLGHAKPFTHNGPFAFIVLEDPHFQLRKLKTKHLLVGAVSATITGSRSFHFYRPERSVWNYPNKYSERKDRTL